MAALWFGVLLLTVACFAVLVGLDFGAGALHFIAARNQEERRTLIAAIGPLWTWREVWLVVTGGILFVAFPRVLATAFPGYYLALFPVLWTLILRGVSLEFRAHIEDTLWYSFWDCVFVCSNVILAILFGAALGNVVRGMPLRPDGELSLPLFTHFGVGGEVGILDWYTVSIAVFTLICLAAHGASYLALKTDGAVYRRSKSLAEWLWLVTVCALVLVSWQTAYVRPQLFAGISTHPAAWAALALVVGGLAAIFTGLRGNAEQRTFLGGCAFIAGLLGVAAASLFPVMLYSTIAPEYSITAYNGSADESSLRAATFWWPIAFILTVAYFSVVANHYRGRVRLSGDAHQPY